MAPGDVKNPLGQIAEDTFEQLGSAATQTTSQVASEPTKILEQILGGSPTQQADVSSEGWVEQGQSGAPVNQSPPVKDDLLIRKQQESKAQSDALYQLHMRRLREEEDYYMKRKQEEAQKKQVAEHQEQQKEEIVQLQKEKLLLMELQKYTEELLQN